MSKPRVSPGGQLDLRLVQAVERLADQMAEAVKAFESAGPAIAEAAAAIGPALAVFAEQLSPDEAEVVPCYRCGVPLGAADRVVDERGHRHEDRGGCGPHASG